jgi:hypothetical protein
MLEGIWIDPKLLPKSPIALITNSPGFLLFTILELFELIC